MVAYDVESAQAEPIMKNHWHRIYLAGGVAALVAFCCTLADIIFGSITSHDLTALPQTALERFAEFQGNWLLGLYHLDLLNVIIAIAMIPAYFALVALHRKRNLPYGALAMVLSVIGTAIFVSANAALPMLELSNKYYATADTTQKLLIAAAGEAMLATGGHGSLGVFMGFLFSTIASICMALVMLQGKVFSRNLSLCGVIGHSLLLVYILLVTFVPSIESIAVMMAAPGGVMALVWTLLVGLRLAKIGLAH